MKRIALAVAAAVLAGLLAAALLPPLSSPERTLTRMLSALQDGNFSRAEGCTTGGLGLAADNKRTKTLYKALWSDMRYLVADSVTDGDQAAVVVSVTLVDMEALLEQCAHDLLSSSLAGEKMGERRYHKLLLQRIRSGQEETLTATATAALVKTSRGWRVDIENSPGLVAAITGNLVTR